MREGGCEDEHFPIYAKATTRARGLISSGTPRKMRLVSAGRPDRNGEHRHRFLQFFNLDPQESCCAS